MFREYSKRSQHSVSPSLCCFSHCNCKTHNLLVFRVLQLFYCQGVTLCSMRPHKRQQLEPRDTSPTIFQEIFGRLVRQNLLAKSQRHNQNWDVISMYTIFSIQSSSKLIWHFFPTHFGYCLFSVVPRIFGHKFFTSLQIQQIEN